MALAAPDAPELVEQLITLTERLTALLAEQATAFEARRPQAAAASAARCETLATLYRRESARVRADPKLVAGAPAARRQKLVEATTHVRGDAEAPRARDLRRQDRHRRRHAGHRPGGRAQADAGGRLRSARPGRRPRRLRHHT